MISNFWLSYTPSSDYGRIDCILASGKILQQFSVARKPIFQMPGTLVWALFVTGVMGGCSINEFGLVRAQNIEADGALVYDLSAPGIHVDTRDTQPSISIGHYRATHVFPLKCSNIADTSTLRHHILFRTLRPQLSISRIVGIQVKSGPGETSLTLGLREHASLISLDRSQSGRRILEYRLDNLEKTYLRVAESDEC